MSQPVPTGIQQLLQLAQVDERFRRQLVARRAEAARAAGVALTESERRMLDAIGAGQLAEMARGIPPAAPPRRELLATAAATAVLLLGGVALGGTVSACERHESSTSEQPLPERPTRREMETEGGMAPHEPASESEKPVVPGTDAPSSPTTAATTATTTTTTTAPTAKPAPLPAPPTAPTRHNPTRGIRSDMP